MEKLTTKLSLLIAVLLSAMLSTSSLALNTRIVGGEDATGDWPFVTALFMYSSSAKGYYLFCGGSLIDEHYVLTAAHCVYDLSSSDLDNLLVNIGDLTPYDTDDNELRYINAVYVHPSFSYSTLKYDFAILELDEASDKTPISLGSVGDDDPVWTLGWGDMNPVYVNGNTSAEYDFPDTLQIVGLTTMSNDECSDYYSSITSIYDSMVCAFGAEVDDNTYTSVSYVGDSCQGDSGGPLIKASGDDYVLVGTVSFGDGDSDSIGCGDTNLPGVYGRVSKGESWIDSVLAGDVKPTAGTSSYYSSSSGSLPWFTILGLPLLLLLRRK